MRSGRHQKDASIITTAAATAAEPLLIVATNTSLSCRLCSFVDPMCLLS